ncbi:methyltransferase N2227 family protein [Schizosaccharomyces cryophilus OY26]|uniref:carnosine N-methyltransferase n=1 Tax=Schizosaccharomyces cryophilus (strain OY26 / ATCC MYA-4695 / CBS 11777 / NBRC 106824 / NRRL Y48691) TaxID=653667 RepID=S9XJW9_SCHCR|nr:methyltransferase N2227 family protein [Schizosaccharomyces cryophilus OY26]EPY53996.1 methyltransferase N2227 family protein [Schizosaccharomyces cryophilus OY26]
MEYDEEEEKILKQVLSAFFLYRQYGHTLIQQKRKFMSQLSFDHKDLLLQDTDNNFLKHLSRLDDCVKQNSVVAEAIAKAGIPVFYPSFDVNNLPHVSNEMMQKVSSTLKQLTRDWSEESVDERQATYVPILQELDSLFPLDSNDRSQIHILVPGSGLGRLAFDIAAKGFSCQGNEFSYFMLLTSYYMLNCVSSTSEFAIHPYIHSFSNHVTRDHQAEKVAIPDVVPAEYLNHGAFFSMAAGDFLEVYGDKTSENRFHVVVTCFFIDTAKNVLSYLDVIKNCLVDGGYWINMGPLLYHFENDCASQHENPTIELTLDQLFYAMDSMGFNVLKHESTTTSYMGDKRSMLEWIYHPHFWVSRIQKANLQQFVA